MDWTDIFDISSSDPVPSILVVGGLISLLFVGPILYFVDKGFGVIFICLGLLFVGAGIYLWLKG